MASSMMLSGQVHASRGCLSPPSSHTRNGVRNDIHALTLRCVCHDQNGVVLVAGASSSGVKEMDGLVRGMAVNSNRGCGRWLACLLLVRAVTLGGFHGLLSRLATRKICKHCDERTNE